MRPTACMLVFGIILLLGANALGYSGNVSGVIALLGIALGGGVAIWWDNRQFTRTYRRGDIAQPLYRRRSRGMDNHWRMS